MSIHADYWEDLAREQRDGTGPEAFRPFGLDDLRDRDEQDRFERAAELHRERARGGLRRVPVDPDAAGRGPALPPHTLGPAFEARSVRFADPLPIGAWLGSLTGAALVGGSVGFLAALIVELVA